MTTTIHKDAVLSKCERFRYRLGRSWDGALPTLAFVMLNPSTADASVDDATIRRCVRFARDNGFGAIAVGNLFAYRATDPADLWSAYHGRNVVGEENDAHLRAIARAADRVIIGWGTHGLRTEARARVKDVLGLLDEAGAAVYHLGLTRDGAPRHPLFVRADQALVPHARA